MLAGGEAYFEHLRGSFNQRLMWTPVWVTPPMVAAAIGAALSQRVAEHVLPLASAVTFLDGLLGFALHLQGIQPHARRLPQPAVQLHHGAAAVRAAALLVGRPARSDRGAGRTAEG